MKKLLLCLMLLTVAVSCGKDNKVSSNGANVSLSNPLMTSNPSAQTLVAQINSYTTSFGQGIVTDYTSNQTCKQSGIFYYCYTTPSSGTSTGKTWNSIIATNPGTIYYYSNGTTVANNQINVDQKRNELVGILNSATNIQGQAVSGGMVYYIYSSAGNYVIDTRYPLQLNPSATSSYYFLRAY
ncbi:MAG: hypothetical protein K2Q18_00580 [Bdellovibrionales bacterium]|nr:hypothetical protein [Bdellovibrionales bacterium]